MEWRIIMNKKDVIAIIGKAGSGKDTILQEVLKRAPQVAKDEYPEGGCTEFKEIISCTSRPKRDCEIEGVNYYFLTDEKFAEKILLNEFAEVSCFNNWFYGTLIDNLSAEKRNIGVFNPEGIYSLLEHPQINLMAVYYIDASDKVRLMRQLTRENSPNIKEIIRRYEADDKDFQDYNLDFEYTILHNEKNDDLMNCVEFIVQDNI